EHGYQNRIEQNTFQDNKCGVHLWWDPDTGLLSLPWAKANHKGSTDNLIVNNSFEGDVLGIQLRETKNTTLAGNMMVRLETELDANDASPIIEGEAPAPDFVVPTDYPVYGETTPIGQRDHLRGRENIIMTTWGPWDHESPLMRLEQGGDAGSTSHTWVLYKSAPIDEINHVGGRAAANTFRATGMSTNIEGTAGEQLTIKVSAPDEPGVYEYDMEVVTEDGRTFPISGSFVNATWDARFFQWTTDPREDYDAWKAESQGENAVKTTLDAVRFTYGWGGPSDQNISEAVRSAGITGDNFGFIGRTTLPLSPGEWEVSTMSDDGVRVTIDGQRIIDNWTHHGPTRDTGTFIVPEGADPVEIVLEHFELNGYSVLEFDITPVGGNDAVPNPGMDVE
ncbi:MAG: PA14 domain-containing protein, partial [Planctomycetota bacterium]